MSETRKLAAILVADVVGYSRLAGADEDRTLSRLRGLRSDLIDPAIDAHHGRVVKRTGDGILHRVPQRGRRGALRHRGAERHGRAQCGSAARAPHRVSRRHSPGRRRRGERPDNLSTGEEMHSETQMVELRQNSSGRSKPKRIDILLSNHNGVSILRSTPRGLNFGSPKGVWAESAARSATAYSEGSKRRSGQGANRVTGRLIPPSARAPRSRRAAR